MDRNVLELLYGVICERKTTFRDDSYTCELFKRGKEGILKKIGEESAEVIIASMGGSSEETVHELADLIYHVMVLMVEDSIKPDDILHELEGRFGTSGLSESNKK